MEPDEISAPAETPLYVDTAKLTRLEIKKGIKQFKSGKAPVPDGVSPKAKQIWIRLDQATKER